MTIRRAVLVCFILASFSLFFLPGTGHAQVCMDFQFGDTTNIVDLDYNGQSWDFIAPYGLTGFEMKTTLTLWGVGTVTVRLYVNNNPFAQWSHSVTDTPTEYNHTETLSEPVSVNAGDDLAFFTFTEDSAHISGPNKFSLCEAGAGGDDPPSVVNASPPPGSTDVPVNSSVQAMFSEPIDPTTINNSTFHVAGGSGLWDAVDLTSDNQTATLTPTGDMDPNTSYTAEITTAVTDLGGNSLENNHSWTFTTGSERDETPPWIRSVSPENGATGVSVNTDVLIEFSEIIDIRTVLEDYINLIDDKDEHVALDEVIIFYSNGTAFIRLWPEGGFAENTSYAIEVTPAIADLAGNLLGNAHRSTFTTGSASSKKGSGGCFISECK